MKRNVAQASTFASQRSYQCLAAPSEDEKKLTLHRQNPGCAGTAAQENSIRRESLGHDVECAAAQ